MIANSSTTVQILCDISLKPGYKAPFARRAISESTSYLSNSHVIHTKDDGSRLPTIPKTLYYLAASRNTHSNRCIIQDFDFHKHISYQRRI